MKPIFQKLTESPEEGLAVKVVRGVSFNCPWHFHPEYELVLVLDSGGYRMVGDNLAPLEPGDLVLVGPNLPHVWHNDEEMPGPKRPIHCILVQFEEGFLRALLELPALLPVERLLERAKLGLHVCGKTRARTAELMGRLPKRRGLRRIITFLEILDTLAHSRQCRRLASPGFAPQHDATDHERINRVCSFIHQRLDQEIRLGDAARLAHLSEGAFSRFFRARLGRSFPSFVNELRVGRACRLLTETDLPVIEIAAACGYSNLSNFNRQFLRLKRTTPTDFRRRIAHTS